VRRWRWQVGEVLAVAGRHPRGLDEKAQRIRELRRENNRLKYKLRQGELIIGDPKKWSTSSEYQVNLVERAQGTHEGFRNATATQEVNFCIHTGQAPVSLFYVVMRGPSCCS
jgi:hypothetical protein